MRSLTPLSFATACLLALAQTIGLAPTSALAGPPATPPVAGDALSVAHDTLAEAAATSGRTFGGLVNRARITDPRYAQIVENELAEMTPESLTDIMALQPNEGHFNFQGVDQVVDYAAVHGQRVHGSRLIVHEALPGWLSRYGTADGLRKAVNTHITTVLNHFHGRIHSWDVVSEAYADGTDQRRNTVFQWRIGPSYIEDAFATARAADPDAELCYSDYYIEDITKPKTQGVYAMVSDFKARGVPIDCVAIQSHFDSYNLVPANFQQTIETFAALGVRVRLSELDVSLPVDKQPGEYRKAVEACLAVPRCTTITVYGVRDSDSWRSSYRPLLFNNDGSKKPAYYTVLDALNHAPTVAAPLPATVAFG